MKNEGAIKERIAYWKNILADIINDEKTKIRRFHEMELEEKKKAVRELSKDDEGKRIIRQTIEELEWVLG